jgi:glycosyltransferase involved in cell wall biosynthesis
VVFVDQTGARSSGSQESLLLLLRALPPSIEPIVVVFQSGPFEQRLRSEGHNVIVFPVSRALEESTRFGPYVFRSLGAGRDVLGLARLFRRLGSDLVHTNTVKAHIVGIPAARLAGIPSVMHLRDALTGAARAALASFGRFSAARSIAISKSVADWYAIKRTDVIYNAVDFTRYQNIPETRSARARLELPQDVPIIGIVGPVHGEKGHERFIRILSRIARDTEVIGAIVGDVRFGGVGTMGPLRALAEDLGVGGRLRFVPWLEDPRIAYAALDVICNCSTLEPFGRSIAEAAACGVPSAIFRNSGVAEVFKDGQSALCITPHDEDEFGRRVRELLLNPSIADEMGRKAQAAVGVLTMERHAEEALRTYEAALAKQTRGS